MINEIELPELYVEALNSIRVSLSKEKNLFSEVRLFGSCAKGSFSAGSDLDILILTKEKLTDREKRGYIRELIDDALDHYNLESDVVFYTVYDFEHDQSDFTKSIQDSFVLVKN